LNAHTISWLLLAGSIFAEVVGTLALRSADGMSRLGPSIVVIVCYAGAIWLMSLAVRHLDIGVAYSVWAGCGTALIALLGIVWFGESASALRLAGLAFIVLGVVTLNWSTRA
jgi:small multidrug resistance pump